MLIEAFIFYGFALIAFIWAIVDALRFEDYLKKNIETTIATIADITIFGGEPLYYSKLAIVNYFVNGKFYISENRVLVSRFASVGDEVKIKYFVDQPQVLYNKVVEPSLIYLTLSFILALAGFYIGSI